VTDNEIGRTDQAIVLHNRYVLGESVGRGGMAEVYRARDTVLRRDVAVKLFHQNRALPDDDARRAGEVHLLAALSHPNLVTVFDAGRDTSNPTDPFSYLVMELVEGTTLACALTAGPMPADELAGVGEQLAAALGYVHERGIVHRDVKPANVLLRPAPGGQTTAKLTDFGVARLVDSTRLTLQGTTLGTANYLSPEQVTGAPVSPASDIYSLGLVLLEGLTGQVAYPGYGVEAAIVRLHRDPVIPAWVGADWRLLITAMTASDPATRPDAAAVAANLRALRTGTPLVAADAPAPAAVPAPPRRRRRTLAAAVGGTAAAATLIGLLTGAGASSGAPVPHYPAVGGTLGADLRALESAAPAALRGEVLAVARASVHDPAQAQTALRRLSTQLLLDATAGRVRALTVTRIGIIIDALAADLTRAEAADAAAARARDAAARAAAARAAAEQQAARDAAVLKAAQDAAREAAQRQAARAAAERRAAQRRVAALKAAARLAAQRRARAEARLAASHHSSSHPGRPGHPKAHPRPPGHGPGPGDGD
jgi:hypothetical protein